MNLRSVSVTWLLTTALIGIACGLSRASGEDWPTFAHDAHCSAFTTESLDLPLVEAWVHQAAYPPNPAWPPPAKYDYWHYKKDLNPRVTYDHAFHVVAADGRIFYGSSSEDQVVCLDARSGDMCWSFVTEGPVRLAPTIVGQRLLFGSDDGYVYCLSASDGQLIWKTLVGPVDSRCIGNGRLISRWPVRSGILVRDDVAYCAAGLFPTTESVFLVGLDATTGQQALRRPIEQAVQGYMLLTDTQLLFPSGRTAPCVYDRRDGKQLGDIASPGGVYTVVAEDVVVAGRGDTEGQLTLVEPETREHLITFRGLHLIAHDNRLFVQNRTELSALDRPRFLPLAHRHAVLKRKLDETEKRRDLAAKAEAAALKIQLNKLGDEMQACWVWRTPSEQIESLILAGNTLLAGGDKTVVAYAADTGREIWSTSVSGRACGLAVAQGQLLVSTDGGSIHCFRRGEPRRPRTESSAQDEPAPRRDYNGDEDATSHFKELANSLLEARTESAGYCLMLGARNPDLAMAVADMPYPTLIIAEPDAEQVASMRRTLRDREYYGAAAVVHQVSPEKLPYPPYFANGVIVDPDVVTDIAAAARQVLRVLHPQGGTAWIGGFESPDAQAAVAWTEAMRRDGFEVCVRTALGQSWVHVTRGPLPGAGEWTHGLADPGNTACSMDQRVHGPVRIQWYGPPGPRLMADRHHRAVPPLVKDGRMFVPGENMVTAVDAYNGSILWLRPISNSLRLGAFLDCSNMVVDATNLFVVAEDTCHVLGLGGGEEHAIPLPQLIPDQPHHWGYVARVDAQLIGSARKPDAAYDRQSRADDEALWYDNMAMVTSDYLFALAPTGGQPHWIYRSGVVINTTITIGGGRVYFLESHSPQALENKLGRMPMRTFLDGPNYLVALDLQTGETVWKRPFSLENCRHIIYLNYAQEKLVVSGNNYVNRTLWYFFHGLDAKTGDDVWTASHDSGYAPQGDHGEQNRHPTIVGDTVYTFPLAYNLHTGRQLEGWKFDRIGHGCGNLSASASCLFWRGGNPWQWDLNNDAAPNRINTVNRPGCFINMIPAGGLLLIPEASSGCTCGFALQTSLAYVPESALD